MSIPLSIADYFALDACNWSTLSAMRDSPKHFQQRRKSPPPDTETFKVGRAAHTAVLEPDRFALDYAVYDGPTSGDGSRKALWAFQDAAKASGRTVIDKEQYALALAMRDAVRAEPLAMRYLKAGAVETPVLWTDARTGLKCKARLDLISASCPAVVDLKTARSIDMRIFGQAAARYGYHCQMAHYVDGEAVANRHAPLPAVLIVVENKPPHDVAVMVVDEQEALHAGREQVRELLDRVVECQATDKWPGRYSREIPLLLPQWIFEDEDGGIDGLTFPSEDK